MQNELVSNQCAHNTVIAAEAITTLDIVSTLVRNVGVIESGKLTACTDCKIVSDMLTLDRIKTSPFALDRGGIISKIMQIEKECKIKYEHAHERTRNDNDESGNIYDKVGIRMW